MKIVTIMFVFAIGYIMGFCTVVFGIAGIGQFFGQ